MFKRIAIIGDGAMGTVLAMLLCEKGLDVHMWGHDSEQLRQIERNGENTHFLPGYKIPESMSFEPDDAKVFEGIDLAVSAVPCQYVRGVWQRLEGSISSLKAIVSVTKGIENKTLLRPTQILSELLQQKDIGGLCVLSGPTIADELARRLPATAAVASNQNALAIEVQTLLTCPWFRVYTNSDMTGVELAGAMKNVIAIAGGMIDGLQIGDNAKASLLGRGLAEITRLGVAMGASEHTFSGLTGLGDLVTTCISPSGRNRSFGERIGQGQSPDQALAATSSVVEGVATCRSVVELARQHQVEMPITEAVFSILFEGKPLKQAITDLMTRQLKAE